MAARKNYIGMRFGRLTVMVDSDPIVNPSGQKSRTLKCLCDCGNTVTVRYSGLISGTTRSCGCLKRENSGKHLLKHGLAKLPEYKIWKDMRKRCNNENQSHYHRYGGRGISVCKEWDDFEVFMKDMGTRPEGTTIDRIDNDGGYSPDNCRWVSLKENSRNKEKTRFLTFNGETRCISEWSERLGIRRKLIHERIDQYGWSVERALTEPAGDPQETRHIE